MVRMLHAQSQSQSGPGSVILISRDPDRQALHQEEHETCDSIRWTQDERFSTDAVE